MQHSCDTGSFNWRIKLFSQFRRNFFFSLYISSFFQFYNFSLSPTDWQLVENSNNFFRCFTLQVFTNV